MVNSICKEGAYAYYINGDAVDDYTSIKDDYITHIAIPLFSIGVDSYLMEDSVITESLDDKADYYTLSDFVTYLGGDPAAF